MYTVSLRLISLSSPIAVHDQQIPSISTPKTSWMLCTSTSIPSTLCQVFVNSPLGQCRRLWTGFPASLSFLSTFHTVAKEIVWKCNQMITPFFCLKSPMSSHLTQISTLSPAYSPARSGQSRTLHFPPCLLLSSHAGLLLSSWIFPAHSFLEILHYLCWSLLWKAFPSGHCMAANSWHSDISTSLRDLSWPPLLEQLCQLYQITLFYFAAYACHRRDICVFACLFRLTRAFHESRDLVLFIMYLQCLEPCLLCSSGSMNHCWIDSRLRGLSLRDFYLFSHWVTTLIYL